jgi:uncharacterized protein YggL (DUF469 family)
MNRKKALELFGIDDENYDEDMLKKLYRARILQYHPDKNKSDEAAERFREIREAYLLLQEQDEYDAEETYDETMRSFLSKVLEEEYAELAAPFVTKLFGIIFKRVIQYVEKNEHLLVDYLRKINRQTLETIYSLLSKYRQSFHLPEGLFEKIGEILLVEEYIVLNPTLEDILSEENIYKLKYKDHTYLVPLWHHEMTFECEGRDLVVRCFPILPDNMELDDFNVLTVRLEFDVREVWNQFVQVHIGGNAYSFDGRLLRLTEEPQRIVLENCGVIYNNTRDVFNHKETQDIVLKITITMA